MFSAQLVTLQIENNQLHQPTKIIDSTVGDLVSTLENDIRLKKNVLDTYEKKLSVLLRSIEQNPRSVEKPVLEDLTTFEKMPKKEKKDKRGNLQEWKEFRSLSLYNGKSDMGEAQIYFNSMGTLRDEVFALEEIKKALDELIQSGLRVETGCLAFFKGSSTKIVFRQYDGKSQPKILFQGHYNIK